MGTNTKCPVCGKAFDSVAAMQQHFGDTHRQGVPFSQDQVPDSTVDGTVPAQRCENCRYWGKANNLTCCRRRPGVPAMVQGPTGTPTCISLYVPALANEWCGEWEAKGIDKPN